jgi:hypothetical protein
MSNYKRAPEGDLSTHVEDTPPPRHEFTEANELHLFTFDEDLTAQMDCPGCGAFCVPAHLGEALDWALGHECADAQP